MPSTAVNCLPTPLDKSCLTHSPLLLPAPHCATPKTRPTCTCHIAQGRLICAAHFFPSSFFSSSPNRANCPHRAIIQLSSLVQPVDCSNRSQSVSQNLSHSNLFSTHPRF